MKRAAGILAVVAILGLMSGASFATTYYVAPPPTGNDSNNGSSGSPWATLQHAVDAIGNGDTILVANGTYAGCYISSPGASGAVKTLKNQTAGQGVIVNAKGASNVHSAIIDIDGAGYWVIDGLVIIGSSSINYGTFTVNATNITIQNCLGHGSNESNFLSGFCDYMLNQNNESYGAIIQHGFYNGNSADYGTERGNYSHDNTGCAYHHNGDASMGGDGEMSYWLIEKNTATNNGGGAENCDGVSDSKFINNLLYKGRHLGVALYGGTAYGGDSSLPSCRDLVYNNTIYFTTAGYDCVQLSSGTVDNKIRNNILIQERTLYGAISGWATSMGSGFASDYNTCVDRFSVNSGSSYITLAAWQGYGWDTHSQLSTAATEFVNAASNDYHLKTGAKSIDHGTTLTEVTTDKDGNSRPQGSAYDVGCYELVQSSALTITTTSLPAGTISVFYSQALTATGGTTPYTWSIQSGSLPAGLSLVASTGVISGTPTATGTSSFTAKVTDSVSATATKALSIVINGADVLYQYTASDSEASTTSTAFQTKATLSFTPSASDDWVILGFAEIKESSTSYEAKAQVVVDATVEGLMQATPKATSDYMSMSAAKYKTLAAGAHTITLQYASSSASGTAYIRSARIVALRKAAVVMYQTAADSAAALTTTMTNYASLSFTPAATNDYLFIWSAEVSARTGNWTAVEPRYDGVASDAGQITAVNNNDYTTFMSFAMFTPDATAHTASIAAAKQSSGGTQYIRRARVIAIQLTGGRFANYYGGSSDSESTTTSTAFVAKRSVTWPQGQNGNWLLLNSARITNSSTSYQTEARSWLNSSIVCGQSLRQPKATSDYLNFTAINVQNITTSRTHETDFRTTNASGTAKIKYARLYELPLD